MLRREAWELVGGLSDPSKMPCYAYGLPIAACGVGAVLRARDPESVCAICYAARYRPSVLSVQAKRLEATRAALADPAAAELYVEAFRTLLEGEAYFRWFDSGDLQGAAHLELIARIARATPSTRHWLPTREYGAVRQWLEGQPQRPRNLRIRLSALRIGEAPKLPAPLAGELGPAIGRSDTTLAQSAVVRELEPLEGPLGAFRICPATTRRNQCGTCRRCWGPEAVAYHAH